MIIIKKDEKIADIYIPKNESWVDYTVVDIRKLQTKDLTVVENGIVEVLPDDEYYALSSVEINVDVPQSAAPQLEELYATENGEYIPNGDGYSRVLVDVPQTGGGECNLEDKIISPETNEVDGIGYLYVYPNEGYDGMKEVALYTGNLKNGWYNEGYEQGKSEGGGGECNLQDKIVEPTVDDLEENWLYVRPDEGFNGMRGVSIYTSHLETAWKSELNLEDKWVTPTYDDIDSNGYIVVEEDEGYNGMSRVVIDPSNFTKNAEVLNVTENGTYYSKFSDIPTPENVTGRYDDGREFYNYATIKSAIYNTNIIPTQDSKITIWVNLNKESTGDGYFVLLSNSANEYDYNYFQIRYHTAQRKMGAIIGDTDIYFDVPQGWCKMEMSITDGLWVNDVKIGDFQSAEIAQQPIWINGSFVHQSRNINGEFGMIKIDDNVIIPTENGFMTENGEMLEVIQDGEYTFVDNVIIPEGPLFKTVNVNVQPKINVEEMGVGLGYSTFNTVPNIYDFEGITSMRYLFYSCTNIKTIPEIDSSKVTDMYYVFGGCTALQSIPALDCSNIGNGYNSTAWFGSSTLNNLTDIGGFIGLKISSNNNYGLYRCPNLTYESCINILNGLYDFVGNGVTPSSAEGKLKVHQNFLNVVGEEISIGTNKGWTITA